MNLSLHCSFQWKLFFHHVHLDQFNMVSTALNEDFSHSHIIFHVKISSTFIVVLLWKQSFIVWSFLWSITLDQITAFFFLSFVQFLHNFCSNFIFFITVVDLCSAYLLQSFIFSHWSNMPLCLTSNYQLDLDSIYYIYPSESPHFVNTTQKFDDSNYLSWNKSVQRAFGTKNKLKFVDGST